MSARRNQREAERWLRQARHDRDGARLSRDHEFFEHACFMAQQSGEKALKAFLYARGEGPVLGHSTLALNGLPDGIPHDFYDRTMADQALGDLDAVIGCVERFVSA